MLARKHNVSSWAWDDTPVKSMRFAKFAPSWWSELPSGADRQSMYDSIGQSYAAESDLQEEEIAAVHQCSLAHHAQRVIHLRRSHRIVLGKAEAGRLQILTPTFHGRTPPAAFAMQTYVTTLNEPEKSTRKLSHR